MSNKRLSRKRLHNMEKLGQDVDVGASPLMKKSIISATQHREGHKVVTDVVVDLAGSKQTLISGGDSAAIHDVFGNGSDVAYICKLTDAVFGKVTSIETVCLEAFVGSAGALAGSGSIDLARGNDGDGVLNAKDGTPVQIPDLEDIGDAVGRHNIHLSDASADLADEFIYFTLGDEGTTTVDTATATITVTETDVANFEDEVSRITLTNAGGTLVHFVSDKDGNPYSGTAVANKFNVKDATTAEHIAQGIAKGITNNANFTATPVDGSSATITVTQSAAGVVGNQTNFFTDAPGLTAGVEVGNFTGGTTKGDDSAITAGKFLLRFTGFVEPSDI